MIKDAIVNFARETSDPKLHVKHSPHPEAIQWQVSFISSDDGEDCIF